VDDVGDQAGIVRAIARTLGALDDKIELNRRVSQTLESMARSLFKSWFVDFDPVRAKAEGRDLNQRSLEEVRRRTKVIGRFPGETSCLTLAWAVMDLVISGARGLALSGPDRGAIAALVATRSIPDAARVA
jgi:hypothetical protein